ncbi:MAG: acyltransferase family protein [Myxococcota bacterium]
MEPGPRPEVSRGQERLAWLYARLQRVTSSGRFDPAVDGLRFIAISWVVLFHIRSYVLDRGGFSADSLADAAIAHGHNGVQLFFVISGFILGSPFAARHLQSQPAVDLRRFYLRRLTRLEPPYLVALIGCYLVLIIRPNVDHEGLTYGLLASIPYLHALLAPETPWVNFVLWSLEIEVQFYLLAPLLSLVFAISRPSWRRAILLGACFALALGSGLMPLSRATILAHGHYFIGGFLIADLRLSRSSSTPAHLLSALGVLALAGMIAIERETSLLHELVFAATTIIFVGATLNATWLRSVMSARPLVAIGGMCYSIYLLHYPLISMVGRAAFRDLPQASYFTAYVCMALMTIPTVVVISTLFYLAIERPCMRPDWPQRFIARVFAQR